MIYQGIDTAAPITAEQALALRDNGVSFVGRYLCPVSNPKVLTATEAAILRNAGLAILLCWELDAEAVKYGSQRGVSDGTRARQIAEQIGVPSGTTIYFAADYNVPQSDLIQAEQYILSAKIAMSGKYNAGIYGGEKVCDFLFSRGTIKKVWQCVAWTNRFIDGANVRQYAWQGAAESKAMAAKTGILAVDMDSTEDMRGAGMWMPQAETHWYDDTMQWAKKEGIMDGTRPEDYATRAEVAQMIRNYNRRFEAEDTKSFSGLLD